MTKEADVLWRIADAAQYRSVAMGCCCADRSLAEAVPIGRFDPGESVTDPIGPRMHDVPPGSILQFERGDCLLVTHEEARADEGRRGPSGFLEQVHLRKDL